MRSCEGLNAAMQYWDMIIYLITILLTGFHVAWNKRAITIVHISYLLIFFPHNNLNCGTRKILIDTTKFTKDFSNSHTFPSLPLKTQLCKRLPVLHIKLTSELLSISEFKYIILQCLFLFFNFYFMNCISITVAYFYTGLFDFDYKNLGAI